MTQRFVAALLAIGLAAVTGLQAHAASGPLYRVTDLGFLPPSGNQPRHTFAEAINDAGQITGSASVGGDRFAMTWDASNGLRSLPPLPLVASTFVFEQGRGINSLGQVAGISTSNGSAFMWDPVAGIRSLDGGPFGGGGFNPNAAVFANDINTSGTVVGMSFAGNPIKWDAVNGTRAAFSGAVVGEATAINDSGQIVGSSRATPTGFVATALGVMTPIPGLPNVDTATPLDINSAGVVVGRAKRGIVDLAFIWDDINGTRYIGDLLNSGGGSEAHAINDLGYVVGISQSAQGGSSFLWHPSTGMHDLNLSIDPADPLFGRFRIFGAFDINNAGLIIGQGLVDGDGQQHSFLLTPIPEPHTYLMMICGVLFIVAVGRFTRKRRARA